MRYSMLLLAMVCSASGYLHYFSEDLGREWPIELLGVEVPTDIPPCFVLPCMEVLRFDGTTCRVRTRGWSLTESRPCHITTCRQSNETRNEYVLRHTPTYEVEYADPCVSVRCGPDGMAPQIEYSSDGTPCGDEGGSCWHGACEPSPRMQDPCSVLKLTWRWGGWWHNHTRERRYLHGDSTTTTRCRVCKGERECPEDGFVWEPVY